MHFLVILPSLIGRYGYSIIHIITIHQRSVVQDERLLLSIRALIECHQVAIQDRQIFVVLLVIHERCVFTSEAVLNDFLILVEDID